MSVSSTCHRIAQAIFLIMALGMGWTVTSALRCGGDVLCACASAMKPLKLLPEDTILAFTAEHVRLATLVTTLGGAGSFLSMLVMASLGGKAVAWRAAAGAFVVGLGECAMHAFVFTLEMVPAERKFMVQHGIPFALVAIGSPIIIWHVGCVGWDRSRFPSSRLLQVASIAPMVVGVLAVAMAIVGTSDPHKWSDRVAAFIADDVTRQIHAMNPENNPASAVLRAPVVLGGMLEQLVAGLGVTVCACLGLTAPHATTTAWLLLPMTIFVLGSLLGSSTFAAFRRAVRGDPSESWLDWMILCSIVATLAVSASLTVFSLTALREYKGTPKSIDHVELLTFEPISDSETEEEPVPSFQAVSGKKRLLHLVKEEDSLDEDSEVPVPPHQSIQTVV